MLSNLYATACFIFLINALHILPKRPILKVVKRFDMKSRSAGFVGRILETGINDVWPVANGHFARFSGSGTARVSKAFTT